jgi:hypothetical protein
MTTPARLAANRQNAQRSTGPRTQAGKAVTRLNALSHGLSAQDPVLPGEQYEEYEALIGALARDLQPVGPLEHLCVVRIASLIWRLARIPRLETGVLLWHVHSPASRDQDDAAGFLAQLLAIPATDNRESRTVADEMLEHPIVRMGAAVARDSSEGDALSKLSRYETRLDRALLRGMQELARLQEARRNGGGDPAPSK